MADHNEIGLKGEKIAAEYLKKNGYKIIATNWRHRYKEVDIIARDGDELVIVEVKLRSTDYYGDPSESVTLKKQRFLIEAAEAYVDTVDDEPEVRFDVISIIAAKNGYKFEHITDAFCP